MGPGGPKCHNMDENRRKMSRISENVESSKTDSPDLIPEGFVGVQGTPGDPWEPLKHPKTLKFRVFRGFGNFPLIPLLAPIGPLGPWPVSDADSSLGRI